MQNIRRRKLLRRIGTGVAIFFILFLSTLIVLANFYVEPVLRKRLQTIIVEGSDSLYTFSLGSLQTNFLGGNIEISNLTIEIDSNRYYQLKNRHALPALVMQMNIGKASI